MSVTTIVFLMLAVGMSLFSKYKKSMAELVAEGDDSATPGDEVDYGQAEWADEPQPSPYFTYETDAPPAPPAYSPVAEAPVPTAAAMAVDEEVASPRFDLRQAVLGQVILDNRYIRGINQ